MITDEQVRLVANILLNAPFGHNPPDDWVTDTRKALETYEASKWVKFDVNDESTHPIDSQVCNVVYHTGQVRTDRWSDLHRFWVYASCQKCVTHWQPLPEFKE